jgi:hypothetical protein
LGNLSLGWRIILKWILTGNTVWKCEAYSCLSDLPYVYKHRIKSNATDAVRRTKQPETQGPCTVGHWSPQGLSLNRASRLRWHVTKRVGVYVSTCTERDGIFNEKIWQVSFIVTSQPLRDIIKSQFQSICEPMHLEKAMAKEFDELMMLPPRGYVNGQRMRLQYRPKMPLDCLTKFWLHIYWICLSEPYQQFIYYLKRNNVSHIYYFSCSRHR